MVATRSDYLVIMVLWGDMYSTAVVAEENINISPSAKHGSYLHKDIHELLPVMKKVLVCTSGKNVAHQRSVSFIGVTHGPLHPVSHVGNIATRVSRVREWLLLYAAQDLHNGGLGQLPGLSLDGDCCSLLL